MTGSGDRAKVVRMEITLPNFLYCLGSVCFFAGTLVNMVRG